MYKNVYILLLNTKKMLSISHKFLLFLIILTFSFPQECSIKIDNLNINSELLVYYLDIFNWKNEEYSINYFNFLLAKEGTSCNELKIKYNLKIFSPEIGLSEYETFFTGEKIINNLTENTILFSSDFEFISNTDLINNEKIDQISSFLSHSGKLPNGKYLFQFILLDNKTNLIIDSQSESLEISHPKYIELISPGGPMNELVNSYTLTTLPLFTWTSDLCIKCNYGIRVSEYVINKHSSLRDALYDKSILPVEEEQEFYDLPSQLNVFQYPASDHIDLEIGKYYVWQIRRSFNTSQGTNYDYSPIYIFEIRTSYKSQLNYSDPLLEVVNNIIGKEQFDLWFSNGGQLENYVIKGDVIWINNREYNIDILYSLLSDINKQKILVKDIKLK